MNSALPVFLPGSPGKKPATKACKAAVFQVANHWLALPATAILKVIASSALASQGSTTNPLALWENHPLILLELHHLIQSNARGIDQQQPFTKPHSYVVIVWSQTGERCAIPVDGLPLLLEMPLSEVQILPPHYRQIIGSIAKHMVVLPYKGTTLTILLLDLQQALYSSSQ